MKLGNKIIRKSSDVAVSARLHPREWLLHRSSYLSWSRFVIPKNSFHGTDDGAELCNVVYM